MIFSLRHYCRYVTSVNQALADRTLRASRPGDFLGYWSRYILIKTVLK